MSTMGKSTEVLNFFQRFNSLVEPFPYVRPKKTAHSNVRQQQYERFREQKLYLLTVYVIFIFEKLNLLHINVRITWMHSYTSTHVK